MLRTRKFAIVLCLAAVLCLAFTPAPLVSAYEILIPPGRCFHSFCSFEFAELKTRLPNSLPLSFRSFIHCRVYEAEVAAVDDGIEYSGGVYRFSASTTTTPTNGQ